MPVFRYQAVDTQGRSLSGVMPAHDELSLEAKLKNVGLWLTEAAPEPAKVKTSAISSWDLLTLRLQGKRHRRQLIEFCTVMTFQVRVAIPLVRALEAACQDCKDPGFRKVLQGLQRSVESGQQFHEALALYPAFFSPHFISVVRAGEMSSKLPEAFEDLRQYLEWVSQVIADVRQATLYPVIVLTVIIAFVLLLFTFVIPKFADLLDKLHVQQPLLTQVVFMLGTSARASWWLWLSLLLGAALACPLGRRLSPRIALGIDRLKLRLPVFGPLNQMLALSRFAHNLAILYRSGLPILQALELCQHGLIGNLVIQQAVGEVEQDVKNGSSIGEAMHRQPVFPAVLLCMVAMGETTGNLDKALQDVTDYYNDIIPRSIKSVFAVLEPALMLFLIALVGAIALAIYLPILSLMSGIH